MVYTYILYGNKIITNIGIIVIYLLNNMCLYNTIKIATKMSSQPYFVAKNLKRFKILI